MLVSARQGHVSATTWETRNYMNLRLLEEMGKDSRCAAVQHARPGTAAEAKLREIVDTTITR